MTVAGACRMITPLPEQWLWQELHGRGREVDMSSKRVVVLSTPRAHAFSRMSMPDGSKALVIDRKIHETALRAADEALGRILGSVKREAKTRGSSASGLEG